jgi:hypothetical protein
MSCQYRNPESHTLSYCVAAVNEHGQLGMENVK